MKALVTGGAGFIGSGVAAALIGQGADVIVLDDLSTGFGEHVPNGARLIEGSVIDPATVTTAMSGVDAVFHQAASRAVQRSVDDPIGTNLVNVSGTLNVLVAARDAGARRVVLASSSSVYGGTAPIPTSEQHGVAPKSPYAVSKLASEHYARVFWDLFGLETVSLRYFNVFGPRQRPDSAYAAVIPLFAEALLSGTSPTVHGDGSQSRDFTYIDDVVEANLLALRAPAETAAGRVFNIARGETTSIVEILELLQHLTGRETSPEFAPSRPGDVRISCADTSLARAALGFRADTSIRDGLALYVEWYTSTRR